MPRVADVVAVLDRLYDPSWAQDWDAVGMVCGDPRAPVRRIMLAVDPVAETVAEARESGADLLLAHHPLLLRPVHGVAATGAKGRVVHDLIRAGIALHVCHTNADVADRGVSDALADAVGLADVMPLAPSAGAPAGSKLVVFVPIGDADAVVDALAATGAGVIGHYTRCAFGTDGVGTFVPGRATDPSTGRPGHLERVTETRVEMVLAPGGVADAVRALRAVHPYDEPAYDVYPLASVPSGRGLGRIGTLPRTLRLRDFTAQVAGALPATAAGVRAAGDPDRPVRRVAVCGGAGDSLLDTVTDAGVDAFVTADLRHHPVSEHIEAAGPALVDVAHWASEWPWLPVAAAALTAEFGGAAGGRPGGDTVQTVVSTRCTDPWTLHRSAARRRTTKEGTAS